MLVTAFIAFISLVRRCTSWCDQRDVQNRQRLVLKVLKCLFTRTGARVVYVVMYGVTAARGALCQQAAALKTQPRIHSRAAAAAGAAASPKNQPLTHSFTCAADEFLRCWFSVSVSVVSSPNKRQKWRRRVKQKRCVVCGMFVCMYTASMQRQVKIRLGRVQWVGGGCSDSEEEVGAAKPKCGMRRK